MKKAIKLKKNINNKTHSSLKSEKIEDLASQLVKLSKGYNDFINSSVAKCVSIANSRVELTENMLNHFLALISNGMQENIVFTRNLVKCKDVNEFASLHQKMLEAHNVNMVNSYLNAINNFKKFEPIHRFVK
ncbi:MAG: hypothetical protein RCG15_06685 [Candidatus Rickettsia vulgarisii]